MKEDINPYIEDGDTVGAYDAVPISTEHMYDYINIALGLPRYITFRWRLDTDNIECITNNGYILGELPFVEFNKYYQELVKNRELRKK